MSDFTDDLSIIKKANTEMLDYFNSSYLEKLEAVQSLKTELFELEIKLEELQKTRDIYTYNTQSRKNVFSPISAESLDGSKNKELSEQMDELLIQKESIQVRLHTLENTLDILKYRLKLLNDADAAVNSLSENLCEVYDDNLKFVEDAGLSDNISRHGMNVLMLEAFDNAYAATVLDTKLKDALLNNKNKLEAMKYLINSDKKRANLTIQELIDNHDNLSHVIDGILFRLDHDIDSKLPIWRLLDKFIMEQRENHPECIIEANVTCSDYDIKLNAVYSLNLIKLLRIFFDNIFKHAHANNVILKILINENIIDVFLKDNGIGISDNYYSSSFWHSGIHRATEIIYLMDGNLRINKDDTGGTTVRFSVPVR